ncbi:MAG: peptide chain release factor N(5)-glutamine methyltransferase [Dehalococcoidia bacterium]|nr:peptide chain release factor N(5)-glutamine methyltransferase [Dehalococcoidia bacterium]
MILREALRQAEARISAHNIPDARIEAELLLMHALGIHRAELYARLGESLPSGAENHFRALIERRVRREPAAYILGRHEFYGIELHVDPRVLIPRPETELLVETALDFLRRLPQEPPRLVGDVGTGSGAVAIALALHLPGAHIYAIDASPEAIDVARLNCDRHGVGHRVELLVGDLLGPLPCPVDLIVANLPYVKDADIPQLMPEIRDFEPVAALSGGADGLDKVRRLLADAPSRLLPHGAVMLEIGLGQADEATSLARKHFRQGKIDLLRDFAGIERVLQVVT